MKSHARQSENIHNENGSLERLIRHNMHLTLSSALKNMQNPHTFILTSFANFASATKIIAAAERYIMC
jgi:vacuolar-type H+-ATPase subunit B/Vma2